ncbi:hypothetical protein ACFLSQ_08865 [Bacteroidota bacterium]
MTSLIVTPENKEDYILLKEVLSKMKIKFKPITYDIENEKDTESEDWYRFSMMNLSKSYSDDEPEYTSDMIREPNPEYNPTIRC